MNAGVSLAILAAGVAVMAACTNAGGGAVLLESPNGRIRVVIDASTSEYGPVAYSIEFDEQPLMERSRLGLEFTEHAMTSLRLTSMVDAVEVRDEYELIGRTGPVTAVANERTFRLATAEGVELAVVIRAYDDAVAIRYQVGGSLPSSRLEADHTQFVFSETGKAWIQPHDLPGYASPAYEAEYANGVSIGHDAPVPSWNMPALFETGERWVLLAEAGTTKGNFGAHLERVGDMAYQITLPQPGEGLSSDPLGEPTSFPWQSPWRVMVMSDELAGIVETDIITHLAEPSEIADVSWIQPGRVSWSWWSDHGSPQNPAALRDFIDLAAEFGWEHTLIDANWNLIATADFDSLLEYAANKNVGVFLWYNSGGSNNVVTEQPRDRMEDPEARKREMDWLAAKGVRGIKVDFFHSDRTELIGRYMDIAADAADAGLMVNFHGSTVPRGWERTWPNILTMEAVRGAEQYGFEPNFPEAAVWHNAILPFTRNVVGPMDYTPVTFSDQQFPHLTTNGHELALSVVYESPLQHFADSADSYRALPGHVQAFLRDVPSTWDETRLLAGYPGSHAVIARRSDSTWYVGAIGGPDPVDVALSFGFLDGDHDLHMIGDPGFVEHHEPVGPDTSMTLSIVRAGGFVMTLEPSG